MSGGRFWRNGAEAQVAQAVAHDYPRQPGEGPIHYAERLAILSGLMRREDAVYCAGEALEQLKRGAQGRLPGQGENGAS